MNKENVPHKVSFKYMTAPQSPLPVTQSAISFVGSKTPIYGSNYKTHQTISPAPYRSTLAPVNPQSQTVQNQLSSPPEQINRSEQVSSPEKVIEN